jgi:hypothetical protein
MLPRLPDLSVVEVNSFFFEAGLFSKPFCVSKLLDVSKLFCWARRQPLFAAAQSASTLFV